MELRVISDVPESSGEEHPLASIIFMCAEDDDLELVGIAEEARRHRVRVEVLPGVEHASHGYLAKLQTVAADAYALFCSPRFTPLAALEFRKQFESMLPGQRLLIMELDQGRQEDLVAYMLRRLVLPRPTEISTVAALPLPPSAAIATPTVSAETVAPVRPVVPTPAEEIVAPPTRTGRSSRGPVVLIVAIAAIVVLALMWGLGRQPARTDVVADAPAVAPTPSPSNAVEPTAPQAIAPSPAAVDASANLALLQDLLGAKHPALEQLDTADVNAAAMILRANGSEDGCASLRAGTAGLEQRNPALLALVRERAELPSCGSAPPVAAAPEPASAPSQRRRAPRNTGGRSKPARPAAVAPPTPPAAPKPQTRLVDDDVLRTSN